MRKLFFILIVCLQTLYASSQTKNIISYNENSKLEWTDFKELDSIKDTLINYNFSTSIQMKIVKVNVWTGVTTFEAYGIFNLTENYVLKKLKNEQLLSYFQLQYDISNSWGKNLEKDINSKKINGAYNKKMEKVFKDYEGRLNKILQNMDIETKNGTNLEMINFWKVKFNCQNLEG
jgi:hypothetical protein